MKFPFYVCPLTIEQKTLFNNYFTEKDGKFYFEGIWFRNQRPENKLASGYIDETTQKRRYVQFYDSYKTVTDGDNHYLVVADTFVYVSNTFQKQEIINYEQKVLNALNEANFTKINENLYAKDDFEVELIKYDVHPKNIEANVTFPDDYSSLDITIKTKGYDCKKENEKMWKLSTKMFRKPDTRGEPTYITSIDELEEYLPAQIEMGCGPSIEVGIPPLHMMHESYKVQNHKTKKFYFADQDDLITSIITEPEKMYKLFSYVPKTLVQSTPSKAYHVFADLYKSGVFCGTVLNNNFDRLVKRFDIDEFILRIYEKDDYLPEIKFDENAKSLICIGTHADRRQVQKQAREAGKKVIFIDPEGFYTENGFEPYPIEAPQTGDLILKTTFEDAMNMFSKKYLNQNKKTL